VFPGYQKSLFIKLLNYISYIFLSFWLLLIIGRRFNKVFIYQTGPLTNALSPVLLKPLFKFKITIWTQDLWPETVYAYGLKKTKFLNFFLRHLVRFIYKGCNTILVSCKGFKSRINKLLSGKKIFWIPNWPLINGFTEEKEYLPGDFNFTFAGNIGKVQNLENVIKAFKSFEDKYPKVYLNIIGDGSFLEELKSYSNNLGAKNINFTGRKFLSEMPKYFAASDVLLISLVDEPIYEIMIPSKFQTYLTAKKPIFAIMKGEVVKMVKEYDLGYSSNPSCVNSIEKGFESFLKLNRVEIQNLSKNSLTLLEDQFSEIRIKEQVKTLFWNKES
jgi:glycosyltransferase involved in cell wall biosynthesis